jgi:hypothetical protein
MNEPTHDPIVTLRLELARVTDQRDAYEKSLRTEVLKLLEQVTVSVAVATDKEVNRLKAEVERLTKAGDAMASSIQFNEEMAQDYNGPTIVHQSVQRWNAAKEGKQS